MSADTLSIIQQLLIEQVKGIRVGDIIIMVAALALVVLVPGYLISIKKRIPYKRFIHIFLTLCYMGIILFITVLRREPGSRAGRTNFTLYFGWAKGSYNSRRLFVYSALNVLLFVPWGFLIHRFVGRVKAFKGIILTVLIGFTTSVLIEVVQYLTGTGVFELIDIATNTTGAFIGAVFGAFVNYCIESCDY